MTAQGDDTTKKVDADGHPMCAECQKRDARWKLYDLVYRAIDKANKSGDKKFAEELEAGIGDVMDTDCVDAEYMEDRGLVDIEYDDDDEEDASDMGPQPPSEGPQPPDNRIAPPEPAAHYHAPALKLDTLRAYG